MSKQFIWQREAIVVQISLDATVEEASDEEASSEAEVSAEDSNSISRQTRLRWVAASDITDKNRDASVARRLEIRRDGL